jgi:hypothetical protein
MKHPSDEKGFPPGEAHRLVLNAFGKFSELNNRDTRESKQSASPTLQSSQIKSASGKSGFSPWNGGVTSRYRWSQSLTEITIEIPLAQRCTIKNDIVVRLDALAVNISVSGCLLIEGSLHARIVPGESTWLIEDSSIIVLSLQKASESWWNRLLIGDDEIDTSRIESSKRVDEYDTETQGMLRKIIYDENQKRNGMLTDDEQDIARKLKSAWNAEGSPFKGTPFDPNVARGLQ